MTKDNIKEVKKNISSVRNKLNKMENKLRNARMKNFWEIISLSIIALLLLIIGAISFVSSLGKVPIIISLLILGFPLILTIILGYLLYDLIKIHIMK